MITALVIIGLIIGIPFLIVAGTAIIAFIIAARQMNKHG